MKIKINSAKGEIKMDIRTLFPGKSDIEILNEVKFKGTISEFFGKVVKDYEKSKEPTLLSEVDY
jgi:hypothetical protein